MMMALSMFVLVFLFVLLYIVPSYVVRHQVHDYGAFLVRSAGGLAATLYGHLRVPLALCRASSRPVPPLPRPSNSPALLFLGFLTARCWDSHFPLAPS